MQSIDWLLPQLSGAAWLAHIAIFVTNFSLLILAGPLINKFDSGRDNEARINILRALNVLVVVLQILDIILLRISHNYEHYFIKAGLSLMAIYGALLAYSIFSHFSRKKFGTEKELDKQTIFLETYSSRLVDILLMVAICASTVYALILIWGADSLLQTTGIFGILAAFLAFTSNVWAPDIISGLIILNTQMLEDGDVVVIDGYPDEYIISKVSFIYVILYDIRNNHRALIRNSRFIQSKIDNLSRIASTDGLRKKLVYQIGYPDFHQAEDREQALRRFMNRIDRMFTQAHERVSADDSVSLRADKSFEWNLTQTGNYALEFSLWVYLEKLPRTKVTATVRKHLIRPIYRVNEEVYTASVIEGLELSTPDLASVSIQHNNQPLSFPTAEKA